MARRARLASRDPALVLADKCLSGCVAGTPLRSPPHQREDVTGPQRAGLGSPLRSRVPPIGTPGLGHHPDFAGSQTLADPGTFRKR